MARKQEQKREEGMCDHFGKDKLGLVGFATIFVWSCGHAVVDFMSWWWSGSDWVGRQACIDPSFPRRTLVSISRSRLRADHYHLTHRRVE